MAARAIIFDLDGTLLDTRIDVTMAYRRALEQYGLGAYAIDDCSSMIGGGPRAAMEALLKGARDRPSPQQFDDLVAAFSQHYRYAKTKPYPGIPALLASLGQRGTKMAVLSNKPHDAAVQCVSLFFPESPFGVVQGYRSEQDKKPSPDGAKHIADLLECPYAQCVLVGDTVVDMETAAAARMVPIAAGWGYGGDEVRTWGTKRGVPVLKSPEELLRYL